MGFPNIVFRKHGKNGQKLVRFWSKLVYAFIMGLMRPDKILTMLYWILALICTTLILSPAGDMHPLMPCFDWVWTNFTHVLPSYFAGTVVGIVLCMHPTNERQRYIVTLSLIGWVHSQNDPCCCNHMIVATLKNMAKQYNKPMCMFSGIYSHVSRDHSGFVTSFHSLAEPIPVTL